MDYQRKEIQVIMESRGISISTGDISILSEQFLLSFYTLHKRHAADLRDALTQYILHLDGTGEAGKEIVFAAKEGVSGITIDAVGMPSESIEYIVPFLKSIKEDFGNPYAIVRDMSSSIRSAAGEVFPGTLQIICHYHFVRDLGDVVFADYTTFRNYVVKTKALSSISKIDNNAYEDGIRKAETVWAGIASEYILYPREIASKFPFALPYIDVVGRSIEIMHLAKRIVKWNILHNTFCTPLMKLLEKLTILTENEDVNTGYHVFQKMWEWFELVRKTLRVCREMNSAASQEPVAADQTRKDLVSVINEIAYLGTKSGSHFEERQVVFHRCSRSYRS